MTNAEMLKDARDRLLKLHKTLLDHERTNYEGINGPVNAGQFLNLLLEDQNFAWLRKFSTLIVEIDEMFELNDGYTDVMVNARIEKMRDLVSMKEEDETFRAKYSAVLQQNVEAAAQQGELKKLLSVSRAIAEGDTEARA